MSFIPRLRGLLANPRERARWRRQRVDQALRRWELIREARRRLKPRSIPADGPSQVHLLLGRRTVAECVWVLHALLSFVEEPPPVRLHDDGTIRPEDCELLQSFFPGIRILLRRDTDMVINEQLRREGFGRLAALRRELVPALKILDLQYYAQGKRVLYLDTDVLFFDRPNVLLDALSRGMEDATSWYNVDHATWYTWSQEDLREFTGLAPLARVNAGLFTTPVVDLSWWAQYEEWLTIPHRPVSDWTMWHREQTLWALHFSKIGAKALPEAEYDVHHRHAWGGMDVNDALRRRDHGARVVSQHYSGTWDYRQMFYHALRRNFFR